VGETSPTMDRDRYRRLEGWVYVNGLNVNAKIVQKGYALVYPESQLSLTSRYTVDAGESDRCPVCKHGGRGLGQFTPNTNMES
jgi:endonuclease YncB( thermonuclease family)